MNTALVREFLLDEAGAEVVEFAIILASFTIVTMAAVAFLGAKASNDVANESYGLSNGSVSPP